MGFVTAKLTLEDGLKDHLKHGLFAESGSLDAVLRFSDFGSDSSSLRFTRIALKLPLKSAWSNEVNLLFTETMDAFPIADYGQLGVSLGGGYSNPLWNIWYGAGFAASAAWVLGVANFGGVAMGNAWKHETLTKNFYSQLPYKLGEDQAMKFQLISRQKTCDPTSLKPETCCLPPASKPANEEEAQQFAEKRAAAIAEFLVKCEAKFDLQLQVKPFDWWNTSTILHEGASSWWETPVKVATLTIPKQECTTDTGVSKALQSALASALGVKPEGVDKMFAFHPISTHKENRPIGDVCTFRAGFYSQHAEARYETYEKGVFVKTDGTPLTAVVHMPFEELENAGVFTDTNTTSTWGGWW